MTLGPDEDYDKVCVLFANIPISYYLISAPHNTFQLTELSTTVTITIPPGDYSANSFINVVLPLINATSPNLWIYTMTINNNYTSVMNGLFYFTVSGNTGQPSFTFPATSTVFDQFGFISGSTNVFVSNSLVSVNVLNFIPETTMYLFSDIIKTRHNNSSNVLQEFYGENNANFSNLVYQNTNFEGYSKDINEAKRNSFNINLQDEYGNTMNLNGRPLFLTLLFYKSNDFFSIVKRFIKYVLTKN